VTVAGLAGLAGVAGLAADVGFGPGDAWSLKPATTSITNRCSSIVSWASLILAVTSASCTSNCADNLSWSPAANNLASPDVTLRIILCFPDGCGWLKKKTAWASCPRDRVLSLASTGSLQCAGTIRRAVCLASAHSMA